MIIRAPVYFGRVMLPFIKYSRVKVWLALQFCLYN